MDNWMHQAAAVARAAATRIVTAFLIMLAFWLATTIVYRLIMQVESHLSSRRELLQLVARSVNIALLILGVLTALGTAGVNVSALVPDSACQDLRYTKLDSGDKTFLIPNSNLFTNPITVLSTQA
jgi:small-conductance mechanosensitive channel